LIAMLTRCVLSLPYPGYQIMLPSKVNLVVRDYFKSDASTLEFTDHATELIAWLCSKTQVLGLMRDVQRQLSDEAVKAVIRAIITRWTAHYQAYSRLLDLRVVLIAVIDTDSRRQEKDQCVISGDTKSKKKVKEMVALINEDTFWRALLRYGIHFSSLIALVENGP
jgi:hypothetical protein